MALGVDVTPSAYELHWFIEKNLQQEYSLLATIMTTEIYEIVTVGSSLCKWDDR